MLLSVSAIYGLCLLVIASKTLCSPVSQRKVGATLKGRVTDVVSGNLFVLTRHGNQYLVRVSGLLEPDRSSDWHDVAAWVLVGKLLGKSVEVEIVDIDPRGPVVGVVKRGKRDICREMIRQGHGRPKITSPLDFSLIVAEREARRHGLGLWRLETKQLAALSQDQRSLGCRGK